MAEKPKRAVIKAPAEPDGPTDTELRAIVRVADAIVMRGGRALLARVLKGSTAREVRAAGWPGLPAYGALRGLPLAAVEARIDWAIRSGYLQIETHTGRPLVCLGPAGWELDRAIYVEEILADFRRKLAEPHQLGDYMYLQEINPEILCQVLDEIRRQDAADFAPVLRSWKGFALPAVQRRIERVLAALEPRA